MVVPPLRLEVRHTSTWAPSHFFINSITRSWSCKCILCSHTCHSPQTSRKLASAKDIFVLWTFCQRPAYQLTQAFIVSLAELTCNRIPTSVATHFPSFTALAQTLGIDIRLRIPFWGRRTLVTVTFSVSTNSRDHRTRHLKRSCSLYQPEFSV